MPRPHVPTSAIERGSWRRGVPRTYRTRRQPPAFLPTPLWLTSHASSLPAHERAPPQLLASSFSPHMQRAAQHHRAEHSPQQDSAATADRDESDDARTFQTEGQHALAPILADALNSSEAWLVSSTLVLDWLINLDDARTNTAETSTPSANACDESNASAMRQFYVARLRTLQAVARFTQRGKEPQPYLRTQRVGERVSEEEAVSTHHIEQRMRELARVVEERLEWLKVRFHTLSTKQDPSVTAAAAWPLTEEIILRCDLVVTRTPIDTCAGLASLICPVMTSLRTQSPGASDARQRHDQWRALLFTARTLASTVHNLNASDDAAAGDEQVEARKTSARPQEEAPQRSHSRKAARARRGRPTRLSALPYLLFCFCALASSSSRSALSHVSSASPTEEDIAFWQTNAADAFCAAPHTEVLVPYGEESVGVVGTAPPPQTPLFPTLLTRSGVFDRAWSAFVCRELETPIGTHVTASPTRDFTLTTCTVPSEARSLTQTLDALPRCTGDTCPMGHYRAEHLTLFWSFCLSMMLREGWRALNCVSAPTREKTPKRKQSRRALVFHAVGAFLSFRRAVSAMHRHGRVLPILELHNMVTGTTTTMNDMAATRTERERSNAAFLTAAAVQRARIVRWSSPSAASDAHSSGDAPSSTDALLWREAVLFDAYTLITVGHTSEGAFDLRGGDVNRAAAYVNALQELCLTHLLQLEAVESIKDGHTTPAILRGTHPLLWSLLTPRTRESLRERLREALRLGTKFHHRLGHAESVRDVYSRCPSMGGSWEVGKALVAAGHYTAALSAFQSLLHGLMHPKDEEASSTEAVASSSQTVATPSATGVVAVDEYHASSVACDVPHVLRRWIVEAVSGAADELVKRRLIACTAREAQKDTSRIAAGPGMDEVIPSGVLLSEARSPRTAPTQARGTAVERATLEESGTARNSDYVDRLISHAAETARQLDQELWLHVRDGCAPLPAAVSLHALLEGILSGAPASSAPSPSPARHLTEQTPAPTLAHETATTEKDCDAVEADDDDVSAWPGGDAGQIEKPTHPTLWEDVYRLTVAAAWLSAHAKTTLLTPTPEEADKHETILRDGLLRCSLEALLQATLRLASVTDGPRRRSQNSPSALAGSRHPGHTALHHAEDDVVEAALRTAWLTIAEVVVRCAHLNLLASCLQTVLRHRPLAVVEGNEQVPDSRSSTVQCHAQVCADRRDEGLFLILSTVLDGVWTPPLADVAQSPQALQAHTRPDQARRLSDAYVLAALAAVPARALSQIASVAARRPSTSRNVSPRVVLLLHTVLAAATSVPDTAEEASAARTSAPPSPAAAADLLDLVLEHTLLDGAGGGRQPWRCAWCQTWNSKRSTTCKHCAALAISLVQCGRCGFFNSSAHAHCAVCRTTLATTSDGADSNATAETTGTIAATDKIPPGAPAAETTSSHQRFPLRAWTCRGCHSRNAADHVFYCSSCRRLKPELQSAVQSTVFTCAVCRTTNPLGMLKPWCFCCGALAPAAAEHVAPAPAPPPPKVASSSLPLTANVTRADGTAPSLWYCLQCGQLNGWVHSRCAACRERRSSPPQTATSPRIAVSVAADLVVPWCTLTCSHCRTSHPAWCAHGRCRQCHTSLHTSAEAKQIRAELCGQWRQWESWAWETAADVTPTSSTQSAVLGAEPRPSSHSACATEVITTWAQQGAHHTEVSSPPSTAETESVRTLWPSASLPQRTPPTSAKPRLDVHVASSAGWVCWTCGHAHALSRNTHLMTQQGRQRRGGTDKSEMPSDDSSSLVVCQSCHTSHAHEKVAFVRFGDETRSASSSLVWPSAAAAPHISAQGVTAGAEKDAAHTTDTTAAAARLSFDPTATVFSLALPEAVMRARGSPSAPFHCYSCQSPAALIRPSGVCSVCGVCVLSELDTLNAYASTTTTDNAAERRPGLETGVTCVRLSTEEWRLRLRLLLREMSATAEACLRAMETPSPEGQPRRTRKKKGGHPKRRRRTSRTGRRLADVHEKTTCESAMTSDQDVDRLQLLISGVNAIRKAPKDALPWTTPSGNAVVSASLRSTAAHIEALKASRSVLRALTTATSDGACSPSPASSDGASGERVAATRVVSDAEWEHQRPSLCAALDLVDVWNDSTENDEIGFKTLSAVCVALRPEQRLHIEQDTRWQYLTNMKLTRAELVRGVACDLCLSREHKTGDARCPGTH